MTDKVIINSGDVCLGASFVCYALSFFPDKDREFTEYIDF